MTAATWLVLLGTWLAAVVSPGPDFVAVLRASLRGGIASGLRVAAGVVAGISTWITAALVGITALVSSNPTVYLLVRWAGALFLLGYGLRILWSVSRARRTVRTAAEAPAGARTPAAVRSGGTGQPAPEHRGDLAGEPASAPGSAQEDGRALDAGAGAGEAEHEALAAAASARGTGAWAELRLGYLTNTVGNPKAVVFFGALFASLLPHGIGAGQSVLVGLAMAAIAMAFFGTLALAASRPVVIRAYERAESAIDLALGGLFAVLGVALLPLW
ncbi:LysE family translocator [Brevibacterium sp. BRM-1]|uniref:LysE family translocator n=1 Tax=Brevibacterium sp. BRM-1 TaxID=2999062 RepID=UPI00227E5522|nr:LysE family translocator [Brevibacterium sp. BRM-1]WAL40098.1 LysE family translocator [Brevibacterium sp. BRM-1]